MTIVTEIEGLLDAADYFRALPDVSKQAASLAINQVVQRGGMKAITDEMYSQVNFPRGYLKGDRLGVVQYAKPNNLEAVIRGRKRATSLARFAAPGTPIGSRRGQGAIRVQVKRGKTTELRNAWLVRLRQGTSLTEDQFNVGLAVRVKKGDTIKGKFGGHKAWLNPEKTVALLYGPSVDQVFRDVADKTSKPILNMVGDEFFRQFSRLA